MKNLINFIILFLFCGFIFGAILILYLDSNHDASEKPIENVIIIAHFEKDIIDGLKSTTKALNYHSIGIRELFEQFGVKSTNAVFKNRYNSKGDHCSNSNSVLSPVYLEGWQKICLHNKEKATKFVTLLKNQKGVTEAFVEKCLKIQPCIAPNDPLYGSEKQWHLNSVSYPSADIDAEDAWNINKGRNDVIIAVCDGGIDYTHRDLDPGDRSHVISGYDSGNLDFDPADDLSESNPLSYAGHGTKVAGVIGARTNNNEGVAGVMWYGKIMPLKMVSSIELSFPFGGTIYDFSTTAFPSSTADVVDYAVNNGAHVINLSYGISGLGLTLAEVTQQISVLYDALLNAYNNNVTIFAAMGNEFNSGNPIEYPAGFNEVIAVGSTNQALQRTLSSNTGPNIDISAPGNGLYTTARNGSYEYFSGTSAATPVASGVAGLIISEGMDRGFGLTNDDVKHILEQTTDDIYPSGWDEETGYGKVNAYQALHLLDVPNVLTHDNSFSGTFYVSQTLNPWIYVGGGRWGLSSGAYYGVDQYQVIKHITFNQSYCSVPRVWLRERQSLSLSFANPNSGFQYAEITNVTTTGFDVKYSVYYVRYNSIGQTLNMWIPSTIENSKIEYTVVGQPDMASTAGPISGNYIVCSSGSSYQIQNLPAGATITWSYGPYLTMISPQGSNPCIFAANGNGSSYISAAVTLNCSPYTLQQKSIWAGKFENTWVIGQAAVCPGQLYTYTAQVPGGHSSSYTYSWTYPSNWFFYSQYDNVIRLQTPIYNPQYGTVRVSITNTCGTSGYSGITVYPQSGCRGYYTLFPNPASDNVTISLNDNQQASINSKDSEINITDTKDDIKDFTIKIYSQSVLVGTFKRSGKSFNVPVSNLKNGIYILEINDGINITREQLIVSH